MRDLERVKINIREKKTNLISGPLDSGSIRQLDA